jgi:hypothetical protein
MKGMGEAASSDSLFVLALANIEAQNGADSGFLAEMQARRCAMLGDVDRSVEWFEEAIRRGNRSLTLLRNPELDPARHHPVYRRLAREIRVTLDR